MYFDEDSFSKGGGGFEGPPCKACRQPIMPGQPSTRVEFVRDEHGMSGDYHKACSKPFDSLAYALNMLSRFGR
jgi:hypothetical protein